MQETPTGISGKERKALLIGAAVFLLGGYDAYGSANYLIAGVSLAMAFFNLLAFKVIDRAPDAVGLGLFLLNAATALVTTYSTYQAGKQWLPYAWAFAALTFIVAGWKKHGRRIVAKS